MKEVIIVTDPKKVRALADPTRFKILELLRMHPMSINELSQLLNKDRSTVYRHVKTLENSGFIEEIAQEGNKKIYGRKARIFLLKFEADETLKEFKQRYMKVEAKRIYEILTNSKINVKDKETFLRLVEEILRDIEEFSRPIFKKISESNVDIKEVELLHLLNLLVLLNSNELCEKAKELREILEF